MRHAGHCRGSDRDLFPSTFLPQVPVTIIAVAAYLFFTALNMYGVKAAAGFELAVTLLAVFELLLFSGVTFPHFSVGRTCSTMRGRMGGRGAWAAVPFAIWFFLGLEGVANVAEETVKPQRNILVGIRIGTGHPDHPLCIGSFFLPRVVAGWGGYRLPFAGSCSVGFLPLPLALSRITGTRGMGLPYLLITIGLMGLIASFHGIILAAGRATLEFGRVRYLPPALGRVDTRRQTPVNALLVNMGVGIIALLSGRTGDIITLSVLGALTLYVFSMITVLALRRKEPGLERPYRVPLYPFFPIVALVIAVVSLIALVSLNIKLSLYYFSILALAYIWFHFFVKRTKDYEQQTIAS